MRILLIALVASLSGCVTRNYISKVESITPGMTEQQVVGLIGHPAIKERSPEGIDTWIWVRKPVFGHGTAFTFAFRDGQVVPEPPKEVAAAKPPPKLLPPTSEKLPTVSPEPEIATHEVPLEKLPEEAPRDPQLALKHPEREIAPAENKQQVEPPLHPPPLAAWYMSRQLVTDRLAPRRTLFPNPRFAPDLTGEERAEGNTWRTWGYVDTVDSSNAPVRMTWTVEVEFLGRGRWKLKDLAFSEK